MQSLQMTINLAHWKEALIDNLRVVEPTLGIDPATCATPSKRLARGESELAPSQGLLLSCASRHARARMGSRELAEFSCVPPLCVAILKNRS